jgi:hypothetical protein
MTLLPEDNSPKIVRIASMASGIETSDFMCSVEIIFIVYNGVRMLAHIEF